MQDFPTIVYLQRTHMFLREGYPAPHISGNVILHEFWSGRLLDPNPKRATPTPPQLHLSTFGPLPLRTRIPQLTDTLVPIPPRKKKALNSDILQNPTPRKPPKPCNVEVPKVHKHRHLTGIRYHILGAGRVWGLGFRASVPIV